ncbi:MAG: hypothetical protein AB8B47_15290 [Roseobacter sp.]
MIKFRHLSTTAMLFGAATVLFSVPTTAQAQQWNMCQWEEIPTNVLERVVRRSEYPDLLERMFDVCPDAALALTEAPTGSVADDGPDTRDTAGDRVNSEEPSTGPTPDGPEGEGPGDDGPGDDGPGDDGPGDDGPGDDGPDDDSPGDDGNGFSFLPG